jgi:hypothetical protein
MKKIPAFLLLAVLLVNAAGFYVYYAIELNRIHREMRAKIRQMPDHALTRLSLTHQQFENSFVENDEVKVNGKMFDIGRIKTTSDSVIVFALHDEKEEDLMAFVNDIVSKPFDQKSGVTEFVVNYIGLNYLPGQQVREFSTEGSSITHFSQYTHSSNVWFRRVDFPPPRMV